MGQPSWRNKLGLMVADARIGGGARDRKKRGRKVCATRAVAGDGWLAPDGFPLGKRPAHA